MDTEIYGGRGQVALEIRSRRGGDRCSVPKLACSMQSVGCQFGHEGFADVQNRLCKKKLEKKLHLKLPNSNYKTQLRCKNNANARMAYQERWVWNSHQ